MRRLQRLEALGRAIADKRDEAVKARKASGIEEVWMACEEAYLGIDDENRNEWMKAKWSKPTSMQGPVTTDAIVSRDPTRSSVYVRLTARYVDAGSAKVAELLLPIDDKPFSVDPTPVPELIQARDLLKKIMQNGGEMPPEMQQAPAAQAPAAQAPAAQAPAAQARSEEHTSELQSRPHSRMPSSA